MHARTRPAMPCQLASSGLFTHSGRVPLRLTCLRRIRPVQRVAPSALPPSVPLGAASCFARRSASASPFLRTLAPRASQSSSSHALPSPDVALALLVSKMQLLRLPCIGKHATRNSHPASSTLLIAALQPNAASIRAPSRLASF